MALTAEQIRLRDGKLTASRVGVLMNGDDEQVLNLWREMVGDPDYVPPSLDDVFHVQLGNATEKLNLDWAEREVGKIVGRGKVFQHPDVEYAASTLDGWIETRGCPIEAKHNNGFEQIDAVINRYVPQVHWQMFCTDAEECGLSVIRGTSPPKVFFIERDEEYLKKLVERADAFMVAVKAMCPPVTLPPPEKKVVEAVRRVDMAGNAEWFMLATSYGNNKDAAAAFEKSKAALKKLVDKDVKEAFGHGIRIVRASNGSLTIREDKDNG